MVLMKESIASSVGRPKEICSSTLSPGFPLFTPGKGGSFMMAFIEIIGSLMKTPGDARALL